MKILLSIPALIVILLFCTFRPQDAKPSVNAAKIENTLVTVSFWEDTLGISPSELLSSVEKVNKVIAAIGYPDAGYRLLRNQAEANKDKRYMIEGSWPNQAIYDAIHRNDLYKNANKGLLWGKLKMVDYYRFSIVK